MRAVDADVPSGGRRRDERVRVGWRRAERVACDRAAEPCQPGDRDRYGECGDPSDHRKSIAAYFFAGAFVGAFSAPLGASPFGASPFGASPGGCIMPSCIMNDTLSKKRQM